jgi:hypothetical protein
MTQFIDEQRDVYGVEPICEALQFATSTYYAVKKRQTDPSVRAVRDAELLVEIRRVHEHSDGTYGAEKIWRQLRREAVPAARCTVERLMRTTGLEGVRRARKRRTTIPGDQAQRPRDLVDRCFSAEAPNRLWVSDFTYVMTWSGVVYVAFVIDAFSRRIVGWKANTNMRTGLVSTCSRWRFGPASGPVCPPAQGSFIITTTAVNTSVSPLPNGSSTPASTRPWAASATPTTTPWPSPRSACSRPRRSGEKARGRPSLTSSSRPWNGSIGSTTHDCILPAADSPQRSSSANI